MRSSITGTGFAVPGTVMTNKDWTGRLNKTEEWIYARSGIQERHILQPGEDPLDLAVTAVRQAVESAGKTLADVDAMVVATTVPYEGATATGPHLAKRLGLKGPLEVRDILAACAGGVQGLRMAAEMIAAGHAGCVLVVALDTPSRWMDWKHPDSMLFGDGCGAVVLERSEAAGILASQAWCSADSVEACGIKAGGIRQPLAAESLGTPDQFFQMDGLTVFAIGMKLLPAITKEALARAGCTLDEIKWFIPHQANARLIMEYTKRAGIPLDRVVMNIQRFGNTCAASTLVALAELTRNPELRAKYPIQKGDLVVLAAIGAGFQCGAIVMRW